MNTHAAPWTKTHDMALAFGTALGLTSKQIALGISRTVVAVEDRRFKLGLRVYQQRRFFSPEEDAIIRSDYAAFVDVQTTAARLGRDVGTLRQRIFKLGLRRDNRKTRLAMRFGVDVLALSDDPVEVRRQLAAKDAQEQAELAAAEKDRIETVLDDMERALVSGVNRIVAFRAAMLAGASLQSIGNRVGITRERVRQLVTPGLEAVRAAKNAIPPRTCTCVRCGAGFLMKQGRAKYCQDCRPAVKIERQAARYKAAPDTLIRNLRKLIDEATEALRLLEGRINSNG